MRREERKRMKMRAWAVAVVAALLLGALPVAAEEEPAGPPDGAEEEKAQGLPSAKEALQALDRSHDVLSHRVEILSRRIDTFLGGKRAYEETSGTYAQAGGSVLLSEGGELSFDHRFRAKLVLPNTRERFKILLESDPGEDLQDPLSPTARRAGESASLAQERAAVPRLFAGLQYVLGKTNWHLTTDAGVRVKFPPDPFTRVRVDRLVPLGEYWAMRASETLFWFYSLGMGESTRIDFERALGPYAFFRSTSEAVWKDKKGMFELSQTFAVLEELTSRDALTYKIRVTGQTDPATHVNDWTAAVEYRRRIHRNWLYLTVEPALTFEDERRFRGVASLRLGLEATFGESYIGPVEASPGEAPQREPPALGH